MSIVNVWSDDLHALICVDTWADARGADFSGRVSKLHYLSHLNIAMGVRGRTLAGHLALVLITGMNVESFDELRGRAPLFQERLRTAMAVQPDAPNLSCEGLELVLVGWSDELQRFAAMLTTRPEHGDFSSQLMGTIAAPGLSEWPPLEGTTESLAAMARRQLVWARNGAADGFGGDLIFAELTRTGAKFWKSDGIEQGVTRWNS